jgi:hypothetical protein
MGSASSRFAEDLQKCGAEPYAESRPERQEVNDSAMQSMGTLVSAAIAYRPYVSGARSRDGRTAV